MCAPVCVCVWGGAGHYAGVDDYDAIVLVSYISSKSAGGKEMITVEI